MRAGDIIDLIEEERVRQGLSLNELGRRAGLCPRTVRYWFEGGGITLENADRALRALGLSVMIGKE